MSLRVRLNAALAASGRPSSDYDLNADVTPPERELRDAAVLIAVVEQPDPVVLLTKRSSALKHHPGRSPFPGERLMPMTPMLSPQRCEKLGKRLRWTGPRFWARLRRTRQSRVST